ncbi:MAG: uroporphyrinogen decarboxylase [Rhodobacteraceae bacterium]|nr:uroporphyrinogen decarboxylase [Paracoccaceae bacterium]MCY4197947.1 uroporphyrinogen decarboxylase [Paracoccaceae bacterium]
MNQRKALLRVLKGERTDPPPVWIMRQAGRYLPEYRELRQQAGDFLTLCYTPEMAAEVTLQPIRRFGFDAAIIFADILLVPHALGSDLTFETGTGPLLSPIADPRDVDALRTADSVHEKLAPVGEALRIVRSALPPETTLIGFAGAPWTVATYMIAGRAVPGQIPAHEFLRRQPEAFRRLINLLTEATIEYLSDQIAAGAETIKIFDSWAGSLTGPEFQLYVTDPTQTIVRAIRKRHPGVPIIAFPRAAGDALPAFVADARPDCVALDQSVNPTWIADNLDQQICVQGNLDPALLESGGDELIAAVESVLNGFAGRPHIFNLGHGINPAAQIGNVEKLLETVRSWRPGQASAASRLPGK